MFWLRECYILIFQPKKNWPYNFCAPTKFSSDKYFKLKSFWFNKFLPNKVFNEIFLQTNVWSKEIDTPKHICQKFRPKNHFYVNNFGLKILDLTVDMTTFTLISILCPKLLIQSNLKSKIRRNEGPRLNLNFNWSK